MIDSKLRRQIAAHASGDLNPQQAAEMDAFLAKIPAARRFYDRLMNDANRLRLLPMAELNVDVASAVISALPPPIIRLNQRYRAKASSNRRFWFVGASVAAGLIAAFWWMRGPTAPDQGQRVPLAQHDAVSHADRRTEKPPTAAQVEPPSVVSEPAAPVPNGPVEKIAPLPKAVAREEVFTSRPDPPAMPELVVRSRTSLPLSPKEMQPGDWKKLSGELKQETDHRLDVFTKDTQKTMEELSKALRLKGITLFGDAMTAEVQKRKLRVGFAVYSESLSASELVTLLRFAVSRDGATENLVLAPMIDADHKDIRALLGVDPFEPRVKAPASELNKLDRPAPTAFFGVFPSVRGMSSRDPAVFLDRNESRAVGKLRLFMIIRPIGS